MKILLINSVCGIGSTGRICTDLAQQFEKDGNEVKIAYGREGYVPEEFQKYAVRIGTDLDVKFHAIRTRILDEHGFGSVRATKEFLKWAEEYNPDLLWLHNLHGYYINIELLFTWIKQRPDMQVKWTLHDCWAFTGHCSHFTAVQCEQWKSHCTHCPQKEMYPTSKVKDNCMKNYIRKNEAFVGVHHMTLITPSKWLAELTRESFLREYPVEVCYNKVDKNIFKPTFGDFREKYCLEDKKIILGVASVWTERKGIYDFIKISEKLSDKYAIVLVGISEKEYNEFEKNKQRNHTNLRLGESKPKIEKLAGGMVIPPDPDVLCQVIIGEGSRVCSENARVICIPRINDRQELAEIYTAGDVFVNPTYEDNYPTVNLEARACQTKVITYDTGGCRETLE